MGISQKSPRTATCCILLLCVFLLSACSTGTANAVTPTPLATTSPTPQPATASPLPAVEGFSAAYDDASGAVLTWTPFTAAFACAVERKSTGAADFVKIADADGSLGAYTDPDPVQGGMQPLYRLCISDGDKTVYSSEASVKIPFVFGNTGGNLQNVGLCCSRNGERYVVLPNGGNPRIYAINNKGEKRVLVKETNSQLNVSGGYLYYLNYPECQLHRVPVDGSAVPEMVSTEQMVFMLVAGNRIYYTQDGTDALCVMNIDGSDIQELVDGYCYDLGGYGNLLYYTNTKDHTFCMRDLETGNVTAIPMGSRGFAQVWDGRIYYQNNKDGRKLYSCALDGSDAKIILNKPITNMNVTARGIYLSNIADKGYLYRVSLDGTKAEKLADVYAGSINEDGIRLYLSNSKGIYSIMDAAGIMTEVE